MNYKYFLVFFSILLFANLIATDSVYASQMGIIVDSKEIHHADIFEYVNVTINERTNGIVNGTLSISHGVQLIWTSSDNFTVTNQIDEYCTIDEASSYKTILNSSSFMLSWRVKFNWTYPEGQVVLGEDSYFFDDEGNQYNLSEQNLFYFEDDLVIDALYVDASDRSFIPVVNDPSKRVNDSRIVSSLPLPEGTEIVSAQSAPFYNEEVLHVWYGVKEIGGGEEKNSIIYTNTTDFVTWSKPVTVISLPEDGIRDPTIFVEENNIYLYCQCYNFSTGNYHPIRLYQIVIGSSYWRSELYNYLGDVLDLGDPGQFDDTWGASFCLRKIGETYYGLYEAKDSKGVFSIGMTSTDSVTNLPYTKLGPAKNSTGQVIYNPNGKDEAIIPDTFTTENICYLHYDTLQGEEETWNSRLLIGDFPENNLSLSLSDLHPIDPFDNHNNIANIGEISGRYTFLMQSWNQSMKNRKLHLYMEEPIVESFESITFIGTLHFEDTNISPNMVGVAIKVVTEGECIAETRNIIKTGKFYIPIKTLGKYKRKYDFTIYSQTDETSKENKTITIQIIGPPLSGTGITIEKDSKIEKIYLIYITIFMIISYYIIKYLYLNE